jgi:hypothetical protein
MNHLYSHRVEAMPGLRPRQDCKAYKQELGFSCKVRDVGLDSYVECLEKYSCTCPFSVSFAHSYYCKCKHRVYIAKKSRK